MFDFDVRDVQEVREPQLFVAPLPSSDATDELAHPIGDLDRRPALVLPPTETVADALARLGESDQGVALVASYGYLLGTLTEKQLVRRFLAEPDTARATAVWRVMHAGPETLKESDSVGYALQKLRLLKLAAMPILHASGRLLGVLECRDLLNWLGARAERQSCAFVGHG